MRKVKNRHRVLLACKDKKITNNVLMLLSSHNYFVELADSYSELESKMVSYKPSILIADVNLLPQNPMVLQLLFNKAKKKPVQLLIEDNENQPIVKDYLKYGVDDLLTVPFDAAKLYRKVKRAAEYNQMQHSLEYHSGMFFMFLLSLPILITIIYLISNR